MHYFNGISPPRISLLLSVADIKGCCDAVSFPFQEHMLLSAVPLLVVVVFAGYPFRAHGLGLCSSMLSVFYFCSMLL